MGFVIFIGLVLMGSGVFVYTQAPSWLLVGAPAFMTPIIKLVQQPNDFFEIQTIGRLRDYSLIVTIAGAILVVLVLLTRRR